MRKEISQALDEEYEDVEGRAFSERRKSETEIKQAESIYPTNIGSTGLVVRVPIANYRLPSENLYDATFRPN